MSRGKVYVVETGAYEQSGIGGIFTTREAAEHWIIQRARLTWERFPGWSVGRTGTFPEPTGRTFDEWRSLADDSWNWTGDIEEYDLWGPDEGKADIARMAAHRAEIVNGG